MHGFNIPIPKEMTALAKIVRDKSIPLKEQEMAMLILYDCLQDNDHEEFNDMVPCIKLCSKLSGGESGFSYCDMIRILAEDPDLVITYQESLQYHKERVIELKIRGV